MGKKFDWTDPNHPPKLYEHSSAKLRLLEGYLAQYVATHTTNPKHQRLRLTVIDGFAGGNKYRDEKTGALCPGSPTVILNTLRSARQRAQDARTNDFNFDDSYVFIEKDKDAFESLRTTLQQSDHSRRIGSAIRLIHGSFEDHIHDLVEAILQKGQQSRVIFVLDQCGYTQVNVDLIASISKKLPNSEFLLTFAVDHMVSYIDGLNPDLVFQKSGIDITLLQDRDSTDRGWRTCIQRLLHSDLRDRTGSKFYTPFYIRSTASNRDLWLIHLSQHVKARDVMGQIHWKTHTRASHFGRGGLGMFGFDPSKSMRDSEPRLPSFGFDELASNRTIEELEMDLPRHLHDHSREGKLVDLYANLANDTPATMDHFRKAITNLALRRELLVKHPETLSLRKPGAILNDTDLIILPAEKRLFLPGME